MSEDFILSPPWDVGQALYHCAPPRLSWRFINLKILKKIQQLILLMRPKIPVFYNPYTNFILKYLESLKLKTLSKTKTFHFTFKYSTKHICTLKVQQPFNQLDILFMITQVSKKSANFAKNCYFCCVWRVTAVCWLNLLTHAQLRLAPNACWNQRTEWTILLLTNT